MRPAQDPSGGPSHTPIYDALYSEYRRSFRALPGDRTGEESLGLQALGLFGSRAPLRGHSGHSSPGGAVAAAGDRSGTGNRAGSPGGWQRVGRHAGRSRPAALPPGSREA
ncbi:hypothetical protein FKN01_30020 [Streptomyces sp. 130]|uniref:hypothetical protein n=1 Tax=Streptomyces sp. 130 TaxID=2591006 RepID=UPI00117FF483|nr:hypothetical protein [Streptomyces sp. 130]TRV72505.1 hypothetical protein FKN01_30020 [Streptomyces sp. 130]